MVIVDDAHAAAFASPSRAPADLADTTCTWNHYPSRGIAGDVLDELLALTVGEAFLSIRNERAGFHDRDIATFAHLTYQ